MKKIHFLLFLSFIISACGHTPFKHSSFPSCTDFSKTPTCTNDKEPRKIAIFFDGTGNTEESQTNISKLHNKITLQDKPYLHTLYIQGVGTEKKISGGAFGAGLDARIKFAYHYLAKKYREEKGDKIYLFGFSRGSYNARTLAGMIHTASLPDFSKLTREEDQKALVDEIFKHYKSKNSFRSKRDSISKIENYKPRTTNNRISFMGLFDTVSALSYRPNEENSLGELSRKYVDQICNIDKVAHAMSIDDNRARAFSPVPMTVKEIAATCDEVRGLSGEVLDAKVEELINQRISEVWFSGAHSDVGGGYSDSNDLAAIPLNWMIRQIQANDSSKELVPMDWRVYEDVYAASHIGEDALIKGRLYINKNRELAYYSKQLHPKNRKLVIHSSVLARKAKVPRTCREYDFSQRKDSTYQSDDYCYGGNHKTPNNINGFGECFKKNGSLRRELKDNDLLADFTLDFICSENNPYFEIEEPKLFP